MEKTYTVYRLISPNTKMYVGITCQKLSIRWNKGLGYLNNHVLREDIQKWGWENFTHEAVATGLTKSEAEAMETELILKHNLMDGCCGYNKQSGGNKGFYCSDEFKALVRESNSKRKLSNQTLLKMSQVRLGKLNPRSKPIYQCTLDGEIIRRWESPGEWGRANNRNNKTECSSINRVCRGKGKTAYGYKWRYVEEGEN